MSRLTEQQQAILDHMRACYRQWGETRLALWRVGDTWIDASDCYALADLGFLRIEHGPLGDTQFYVTGEGLAGRSVAGSNDEPPRRPSPSEGQTHQIHREADQMSNRIVSWGERPGDDPGGGEDPHTARLAGPPAAAPPPVCTQTHHKEPPP